MKNAHQKKTAPRAGFVIQAAMLGFAAVCCVGLSLGFARAYFVTERGVADNPVTIATYAVTVYDGESGDALRPDASGAVRYACPLTQGDWHYFRLEAEGTAYSGHCTVNVENEQGSYVIRLDPDESGAVALQAAEGSVLTFSFHWGEGEDPLPPESEVNGVSALGVNAGGGDTYIVTHSTTPHLEYTVVEGASMGGIAAYYGADADGLCVYNGLDGIYEQWEPLPAGMPMSIPYGQEPADGPYVPRGDLTITVESVGAQMPRGATMLISGPYGYWKQLTRQDLTRGCQLSGLPAGEYELALLSAELDQYDLETTGPTSVQITENGELTAAILNTYTRHVGELKLYLTVDGAQLPEDAALLLTGPDGTYRIPCDQLSYNSRYGYSFGQWEDLPTGEYTVELIGAQLENYDLLADELCITVQKDQQTAVELDVEYVRHVGELSIRLSESGGEIPGTAVVLVTGPDGYRQRISCGSFEGGVYVLEDLPTGEYTVELIGAELDEHTLSVNDDEVTVRQGKTASAVLKAKYAAQVGDLTVTVRVDGAPLSDDAYLTITGPDGYSESVACRSCTLEDLPVGTYRVTVMGAQLDGYEVETGAARVQVTADGGTVTVSIVYTPAPAEEPEPTEPDEPEDPSEPAAGA